MEQPFREDAVRLGVLPAPRLFAGVRRSRCDLHPVSRDVGARCASRQINATALLSISVSVFYPSPGGCRLPVMGSEWLFRIIVIVVGVLPVALVGLVVFAH
jgi:hypothetical protein